MRFLRSHYSILLVATVAAGCGTGEARSAYVDCDGSMAGGCSDTDLGIPPPPATNKVDVLFVVDNSPSMGVIQSQLHSALPSFVTALDAFRSGGVPTSFHIGVVTSDLGAGPGGSGGSGCAVDGTGGKLVALGVSHGVSCKAPADGRRFVALDQIVGSDNLPAGQSLAETLACMTAVGEGGCGFEHVLESPYRALHPGVTENVGFLREDALLAIIFVTNEDDCSASPDSDLFDTRTTASYGQRTSFRCTAFGIMCGNPPNLPPKDRESGPLADCQGATSAVGGKLFDVDRYIDYFTRAGGVKTNPSAVILASLAAPAAPVQIVTTLSDGSPCTQLNCPPRLEHSCSASAAVFGDPAVRLSQVVRSAGHHYEANVCDADYSTSLAEIGRLILQERKGT